MVQPVECRCIIAAIKIGGEDVCPLCGVKRGKKASLPPLSQQSDKRPNGSSVKPPAPAPAKPAPQLPSPPQRPVPVQQTRPVLKSTGIPLAQQDPRHFDPKDHSESVLGRHLCAATNRGKVHLINQDSYSINDIDLGSYSAQLIVVCDGVSSAQQAEVASRTGAISAIDSLVRLLKARVDVQSAMKLSISVADMAVRKIPFDPNSKMHPPGATIAAAIYCKGHLTVGWIGDSRVYWIDKTGVHLLTKDHSWINMVVDAGSITQEQAEKQPDSHRIFRCIGPIFATKSSEENPVDVNHIRAAGPGRVVVCTDGLWNYLPNPETLHKLVAFGPGSPDPLTQAQNLINFACSQGGKDNITVGILAVN